MSDAINLWLTGNDETSLQTLAQDAVNGDTSAQLVLGQVDRDTLPGGFSDYLLSMTRAERAELLRAKNPDGTTDNWLLVMSDPDLAALGEALFWYKANLDPIDSALNLQMQSETAMAEFMLWHTINIGHFDLVQSMPSEDYGLSDAGFLVWLRGYFSDPNKAISISKFLADDHPQKVAGLLALKRLERVLSLSANFSVDVNEFVTVMLGKGKQLPPTSDLITLNSNLSEVARVDPRMAVVDRMCGACPESDVDYQCMIQTFEIIGGYETLMSVRSPAETAISTETYITSDRAVTALQDVVRGRAPSNPDLIRSSCLAGIISGAF